MAYDVSSRFQREFGPPPAHAVSKVRDHMVPWIQDFVERSPFVVMATCDGKNSCDASPRGGEPGFVKVIDERSLLLPDASGNNLFQSAINLEALPLVGLLFLIPGIPDMARINGTARVIGIEAAQRILKALGTGEYRQAIHIEVKESYGHCRRAAKFARLWNTDLIAANATRQEQLRRPKGI